VAGDIPDAPEDGWAESCESCGAPLTWVSEAYRCGSGCTFCSECTQEMEFTCPNCGQALRKRPARTQPVGRRKPAQA
jgi:hypothetical protein